MRRGPPPEAPAAVDEHRLVAGLAGQVQASVPCSLPPMIASLMAPAAAAGGRRCASRSRAPASQAPYSSLDAGAGPAAAGAATPGRCAALVDVELGLRHAGEAHGGRHDRGDDVGAGVEAPLEAGDAVHVERRRDEAVGHGEAHGGDEVSSANVVGQRRGGQRRARLRDEGHDAHLLPPASRMATMEAARSAAVSPMPVSRPSSTSRPAAAPPPGAPRARRVRLARTQGARTAAPLCVSW